MSPRSIRRAAERRQAKQARKQAQTEPRPSVSGLEITEIAQTEPRPSGSVSQSTGPRTPEGKQRSSQNSFKHGLYSKALVLPHECAADFDDLRANLRAEHQPASTTEEILVDELAQHFWRLRRFRSLEASLWQPENLARGINENLIALTQRSAASAERGFHKSLAALRQLQKDRKFVPQPVPQQPAEQEQEFVPSLSRLPLAEWLGEDDGFPENVADEVIWDIDDPEYREFMAARKRVHQFVSSNLHNREQAA